MFRTFVITGILVVVSALQSGAQTPACLPDTARETIDARHDFGIRVSVTDPTSVAERNDFGLPALNASDVTIVTDSVACAAAGNAFYSTLGIVPDSSQRFIVLQAGSRRIVRLAAQTSHYTMHVVFDSTFATVISKFWH